MRRVAGSEETVTRLLRLAVHLARGGEVSARFIREQHGASKATAHRDLQRLELALPVVVESRRLSDQECNGGGRARRVLRLASE